jgi:carbon monoxide dehydrogenase subunit G
VPASRKPFEIVRKVTLPQSETFARLTDWERHAEPLPATTVWRTDDGFVVRQKMGRIILDDPMEIVEWDPPRRVRIEKRGRTILGWAEISVEPDGEGSVVRWREVAHVRGVPRFLAGAERAASRVLFGRLLTHLTRS